MLGITPTLLTLISLANTDIPSTQRELMLYHEYYKNPSRVHICFFFRHHLIRISILVTISQQPRYLPTRKERKEDWGVKSSF